MYDFVQLPIFRIYVLWLLIHFDFCFEGSYLSHTLKILPPEKSSFQREHSFEHARLGPICCGEQEAC